MTPRSAPHLPPKSCDIKLHQRFLALPGILFIFGISLLSGFSAALMTFAWIVPPLSLDGVRAIHDGSRSAENNMLDVGVESGIRQRLVSIFDTTKKTSDAIYPESALVTHAALLSSDGWAVLRVPSYRLGREKNWEAIDAQGVQHRIEAAVFDSVSGLLYVRLNGDGFRIFPFADWNEIHSEISVWYNAHGSGHEEWKAAALGTVVRATTDPVFPVWRPEYVFRVAEYIPDGSILVDDNGALLGFGGSDHTLISSWLIRGQLPSVLSKQPIRYDRVPLQGYMVEAVQIGGAIKFASGFYVAQGHRQIPEIRRGDIIIRINNEPVKDEHLARMVLLSPDDLSVAIVRDGMEQEVNIRKIAY